MDWGGGDTWRGMGFVLLICEAPNAGAGGGVCDRGSCNSDDDDVGLTLLRLGAAEEVFNFAFAWDDATTVG